jgi:hypothetical protein
MLHLMTGDLSEDQAPDAVARDSSKGSHAAELADIAYVLLAAIGEDGDAGAN